MEQNHQSTSSNGSGVVPPEPLMYKNHLITYTQRTSIPSPVYETVNLGYRCTVHVDGVAYTTVNTFRNPKDAEQDASRLALESIAKKIKEESVAIINQDPVSCKSILNEYAVKMNLPIPMYTTAQQELLPIFNSSLEFDGKTYTGPAARNKKDAERFAARMVIQSIIGTSGSGNSLPEIIISKSRLSNAPRMLEESQTIKDSDTEMAVVNLGSNCGSSARKRKQILNPSSQACNEDVTSTRPPSLEYKKLKETNSCEANAGPMGNVGHLLVRGCSDSSASEHCKAVSDAPHIVEESQTIQDTNMAVVASHGSDCGPSRVILNSSSQALVGVVTEAPPPSNGIGNTAPLLDQPVDGCSDRSDTVSYKSILNEYAVKINHPTLVYTTRKQEHQPFFISSLEFNDKTYTGPAARNKKEAERLAARMVIHSITGTSDPGTCLSEITKLKSKLSNAPCKAVKGTSTRKSKEIVSASCSQMPVEDVRATPPLSHALKTPKEEPSYEANVVR